MTKNTPATSPNYEVDTILIAIHDFENRSEDELDFVAGEKILVIENDYEFKDGWYIGKKLLTGNTGLFPRIFTGTEAEVLRASNAVSSERTSNTEKNISTISNTTQSTSLSLNDNKNNLAITNGRLKTLDIDEAINELNNQTSQLSMNKKSQYKPISQTSNILDPTQATSWTPQQVANWFTSRGFDNEISSLFKNHKISGAILLELELSHLKELEISTFGTRFEIFKEIESLRTAFTGTPTSADDPSIVTSPKKQHAKKLSQNVDDFIQTPIITNNEFGRITPSSAQTKLSLDTTGSSHTTSHLAEASDESSQGSSLLDGAVTSSTLTSKRDEEQNTRKSNLDLKFSPFQKSSSSSNTSSQPQTPKWLYTGPFRTIQRSCSNSHLRYKSLSSKQKTSAFREGIQQVTPHDAALTADYSGWMSKKGSQSVGTWKSRFFCLHGTRLSYFTSLQDCCEKGLIDITSHKPVPARDEDKLVAIYASSTGSGRYCFKLLPPAPGSKKGAMFTLPKVHYFAVDTAEDMKGWINAFLKATIDRDDSVPIVSSCLTPTVTLFKAQEMLQENHRNVELLMDRLDNTNNNNENNKKDEDLMNIKTSGIFSDAFSSQIQNKRSVISHTSPASISLKSPKFRTDCQSSNMDLPKIESTN